MRKIESLLDADYKRVNILFWDIETSLMQMSLFSLYTNGYLNYKSILNDWYMLCASWKRLGDKKVQSVSLLDDPKRFKRDIADDYHVVKTMHEILGRADALIGHNGDKFDLKKFNARAIFHGFDPLPEIPTIDTLKIAKHKFNFTSNRLDYLAAYLRVGEKLHTSPDLWLRCLLGQKTAIRDMVKYNKVDVSVLERVYGKLAPFAPAKLNMNLFGGKGCPLCGSGHIQKRGTYITRTYKYQRYTCNDCGHGFRSAVSDKNVRAILK